MLSSSQPVLRTSSSGVQPQKNTSAYRYSSTVPCAVPSIRFTSRSFEENGSSARSFRRRESTTFSTRPLLMASSPLPTACSQAERESSSSWYETVRRVRCGAVRARRAKRSTRPAYTGPREFTCRKAPRSFSMSTTSGSMKCRLGNDWNSSSAGAGLCASNRLNEKNTGCSAAGPVSSHSTSSKVGNAIQRPKPMKRVGRSLR